MTQRFIYIHTYLPIFKVENEDIIRNALFSVIFLLLIVLFLLLFICFQQKNFFFLESIIQTRGMCVAFIQINSNFIETRCSMHQITHTHIQKRNIEHHKVRKTLYWECTCWRHARCVALVLIRDIQMPPPTIWHQFGYGRIKFATHVFDAENSDNDDVIIVIYPLAHAAIRKKKYISTNWKYIHCLLWDKPNSSVFSLFFLLLFFLFYFFYSIILNICF